MIIRYGSLIRSVAETWRSAVTFVSWYWMQLEFHGKQSCSCWPCFHSKHFIVSAEVVNVYELKLKSETERNSLGIPLLFLSLLALPSRHSNLLLKPTISTTGLWYLTSYLSAYKFDHLEIWHFINMCIDWLVGWLIDWFDLIDVVWFDLIWFDWLIDWLIDWLTEKNWLHLLHATVYKFTYALK